VGVAGAEAGFELVPLIDARLVHPDRHETSGNRKLDQLGWSATTRTRAVVERSGLRAR
jgi:hypothetical protein